MSGAWRGGRTGRSGAAGRPVGSDPGGAIWRSASQPKSRASCRSSTSSARRSRSRRRAPPTRACARSTARRRRRSSSPRPARAGTASAAAWAATSSASSCSATASTFPEALRTLAEQAGVEIDERTKREDARKARLREVLDTAIAFYHAVLTGSKAGEPALDVPPRPRLHRRDRSRRYQLGWAPGGWDADDAPAPGEARRPPRGARRGRARQPEPAAGGGVYDQFRARVIFPIRDQNGHAVGLGGRLLEGEGPEVPQLPGDAALRQEPDALPHRQGQGPDPQAAARPSSSRATPTR